MASITDPTVSDTTTSTPRSKVPYLLGAAVVLLILGAIYAFSKSAPASEPTGRVESPSYMAKSACVADHCTKVISDPSRPGGRLYVHYHLDGAVVEIARVTRKEIRPYIDPLAELDIEVPLTQEIVAEFQSSLDQERRAQPPATEVPAAGEVGANFAPTFFFMLKSGYE